MPFIIYEVTSEELNIDYIYNRVLNNGIPITGVVFNYPYVRIYLDREVDEGENTFIAESISRALDPNYSSIPEAVYEVKTFDDYGRLVEKCCYEDIQNGDFTGISKIETNEWDCFRLIRKIVKSTYRDGTVYDTQVNEYFSHEGKLVTKVK